MKKNTYEITNQMVNNFKGAFSNWIDNLNNAKYFDSVKDYNDCKRQLNNNCDKLFNLIKTTNQSETRIDLEYTKYIKLTEKYVKNKTNGIWYD